MQLHFRSRVHTVPVCDVPRKPRRQLAFGRLCFDDMCFGLSKACLRIVNRTLTNSKYRERSFKQYAYVESLKRPVCIISFAMAQ